RPVDGAEHGVVEGSRGHVAPHEFAVVEYGFLAVAVEAGTRHGVDVRVEQARVEQGADEYLDTSGGVEVVDVGAAVGIDVREQRHGRGQFGEVVPGQCDARGGGDGDEVERVVGRASRGQERDEAVDDGAFVDDVRERGVLVALRDVDDAARGV